MKRQCEKLATIIRDEARPGRRVCRRSTMIALYIYIIIVIMYTSIIHNTAIRLCVRVYALRTLGDPHHVSRTGFGCHLNIICLVYTTDPCYIITYSYYTRTWNSPTDCCTERVTPADLHTIYYYIIMYTAGAHGRSRYYVGAHIILPRQV